MNFTNYINQSVRRYPQNSHLESFKQDMESKMQLRAAQIRAAGLQDEGMLYEIVTGLYPDIEARYQNQIPKMQTKASLWDIAVRRSFFGI